MKLKGIYSSLCERKNSGKKSFAVLIDPDKVNNEKMHRLIGLGIAAGIDYFLVGGSLVVSNYIDECVGLIKQHSSIPVILFPGSPNQVSKKADALLYLSLNKRPQCRFIDRPACCKRTCNKAKRAGNNEHGLYGN